MTSDKLFFLLLRRRVNKLIIKYHLKEQELFYFLQRLKIEKKLKVYVSFQIATMPISRIARTHLMYQFIILTLLFLGIGYYELFPDRKFVLYIAFMPIFLYQLLILACCTGLLTIPGWMNVKDISSETSPTLVENQDSESSKCPHTTKNGNLNKSIIQPTVGANVVNCGVNTRTYKFRNWKANSSMYENKALQSPSISSIASIEKSEFTFGKSESKQEAELTKRYFFPYRQKRLEQWIESAETVRPYKIKTRNTNFSEELQSDARPSSSTAKTRTTESTTETSAGSVSSLETELTKSYSFPFRQKRLEEWNDSKNKTEESSAYTVPYWQTVGYSIAVKKEARRRRRSISSSRLNYGYLDESSSNARLKEFSQSVEITNYPISCDIDKITHKAPALNFSKIKQGFATCFSRIKKDNCKVNANKLEKENRRRLFKSVSKENTAELSGEKSTCSSPTNSRADVQTSCSFYPTYIPFEKFRFEKDVQQRMLELSTT